MVKTVLLLRGSRFSPGQGTRIPHATCCSQIKKKKFTEYSKRRRRKITKRAQNQQRVEEKVSLPPPVPVPVLPSPSPRVFWVLPETLSKQAWAQEAGLTRWPLFAHLITDLKTIP